MGGNHLFIIARNMKILYLPEVINLYKLERSLYHNIMN